MTGYGSGKAVGKNGLCVEVGLSSVNRRQFECRVNLPRQLVSMEAGVRKLIAAKVGRGSVTGSVVVSRFDGRELYEVAIDECAAKSLIDALRRTGEHLGLEGTPSLDTLLRVPGLVTAKDTTADSKELWPLVEKAIGMAVRNLVISRDAEGRNLKRDIEDRAAKLRVMHGKIATRAPSVVARYRKLLKKRLADAGCDIDTGDPVIVRDIALFADKSDISEELVRLKSHLDRFDSLVSSKGQYGRELDFICQEMFREINTIGAKANDTTVSRHVVSFKAELDRIREQVQNVE